MRTVKKLISMLLALVMVLSLLPTTALAADRGTVEVPYINDLGREASAGATPLTGSETELGTGFYAVTDNVTFNHPVTVTGRATSIILCDGKTAAFSSISVSTTGNCQLRFYGQEEGSGSLTATNLTGGLINIYGGTISARTMTATPLNMFDGTLSADALTVGWYADFTMSSHFFGGIVDVNTLTVQDHDFTIGTENTPSPTDSFCAGSYVIAQGLKLHFANTFTAAEPDGNGAYIRYSGDYDNSAAAALKGKTLRPYITHTVNWVVEGETKETDTVLSGSPALYDGATPTKPDEQGKKYIFSGWSDGTNTYAPDALPPVTADVTYTAVFVAGHGIKVWYWYINPDMPNEPSSTVTPSVDVARAGETVTLTVNAAPKEKLTEQKSYSAHSSSSVTLTNGFYAYSSSEIISIEKSGDSYSFVMPDAEVTINAFFDSFNYSITVGEPVHGHMDVYKLNGNEMTAVNDADEGDMIRVRLTADPDDPYIVTGMTYTYTEDGENKTGEISLTNEINQLYLGTFTMPASDVVISIADQAAHRIRYESSALKQDYFSEAAGNTVTLTPENGYTVTSVYVKCGDEYVTVTANADGTFSFTMPDGDVTVFTEFSYIDLDGSAKTSTPTIIAGDMTDLNTGWYAVDGNITNNNRISVNGDVNLILCDGATLTAPKGISVNSGNSLTIWGQTAGSGALKAMIDENDEDLYYLAAIGGYQTSSGSITINGGTVTAKGGVMAAGIGGGRQGDGKVVINGGTVTAIGGNCGAGIGGGQRSDSNGGHGNVTITGGTVTATGGAKSAGIGGGYNFDNNGTAGATAVISGGVVNATGGGSGGVGIGGSADGSSISLGWKDFDHDSIKADSYAGMVTLTKDFTDGTNGYAAGAVEDNTVLAGKTLIPAVLHTVTVSTDENGTVTADKTKAEKGETVTVTPQPADGYTYSGVVYAKTDDPTEFEWAVLDEASGNYTFEMPAYDVTVSLSEITKKSYSLDLVVTPEADNVLSVKDDQAQWGYLVFVTYYSDSGYQVRKIYYKIDGDDKEYALTEDLSGGYSFTMPMANVTIFAEIEAITYPVSVDFGAGHEAFVRDLFEGNDEYSVDGSVVTFRMPAFNRFNKHSTLSDAYNMITDYCNTNVTDPLDNNKRFMYQFGLKARRGYEGEEEFNREREGYYETPLNKDEPSTLYALWAEPAAATVTVTPPKCGTVLTKDVYHSAGRFNPVPELTVSGNASIRDESFEFTNWLIENADDYQVGATVTLTGENTYSGRLFLNTEWGYFLDSSTAEEAITVVGGTLVSCDTDGKVVISVPVEHSYGEDGICTGCGASQSATPAFKVQSLRLSGEIGVNFFLDLSALTEEQRESGYMTFDVGTTVSGRRVDYDKDFLNQTGEYYGFTCYVNAIQMADTITATYHYTVDGEEQTIQKTYSVEDYIAARMANSSVSETEQALIKSIKDYGYYSQIYLSDLRGWSLGGKYAKMTEPYASSYDTDSMITPLKDYEVTRNLVSEDIEKITFALVLDSSTSIYLYIKPAEGYTGSVSAAVDGTAAEAESLADGRYRVMTPGISAHKLGDNYTVTITTDNGTSTVRISAMSYAYACISNTSSTEDAKNSAAALYSYYKAADTFKKSN